MDSSTGSTRLGDLELPPLAPHEVLVQSRVVGLCRSDIEMLHGHLNQQLAILRPIVPGHEWSGVVSAVGSAVTDFAPGDRVVGECVLSDDEWFGFTMHGAGAEQFVVPARLLHRIPAELNFSQAALIEPFTIAFAAIRRAGGITAGNTVVILGAGMIGLAATSIAVAMGASVVTVDLDATRRDAASSLGAAKTAASSDEASSWIRARGLNGADLVVEASGHPIAITSTFELARFEGHIVNIGICAADTVTAPLHLIQAKNLTVHGTTGSAGLWPEAITFLQEHSIDLSGVVTASYAFDEIDEALRAVESGNIKVHLLAPVQEGDHA
ncbi:MAG: zinc-binding dehydrogenase [Arthrobacter sp.]|jgi:L-iditol 2-dehydrogenase|nr:zinc-binding dehydrogenase [Arthrobacter sp.]